MSIFAIGVCVAGLGVAWIGLGAIYLAGWRASLRPTGMFLLSLSLACLSPTVIAAWWLLMGEQPTDATLRASIFGLCVGMLIGYMGIGA